MSKQLILIAFLLLLLGSCSNKMVAAKSGLQYRILEKGNGIKAVAVDEDLRGMQVVEISELIAPPYLVKGKEYPANVSPDSTLVIKMKLAKIEQQ